MVGGGGSLRRLSQIGYQIIPFTLALIAALPIKFKLLSPPMKSTVSLFLSKNQLLSDINDVIGL